MTEMQKWKLKEHWAKWSFLYSMAIFLIFCIAVIGLEARGVI